MTESERGRMYVYIYFHGHACVYRCQCTCLSMCVDVREVQLCSLGHPLNLRIARKQHMLP